jgi:hypothetical protein
MPVAVADTTHRAFARWSTAGVAHAVGTLDEYRGGVQHIAALETDPDIGDRWVEDVARGDSITLRVVDRPDLSEAVLAEDMTELLTEDGEVLLTEFAPFAALWLYDLDGQTIAVEVVTAVTYEDGSSAEFARTQTLSVTARSRAAGVVTLTLTDIEDQRLGTPFPPRQYATADWPQLLTSDAGRAVPDPRGIALKLPCVLISALAPWRYIVAEGTVDVLTVYRGGSRDGARVVPPAEYSTGTAAVPYPHTWVEFTAEQRGFDGGLYAISADVQTTAAGVNAATEVARLLQAAGCSVDASSLAAAEAFAATHGLLIDCDHGREGQRTVRAIVEDLLWVLRGTLTRTAAGAYALVVDGSGSSVATLDEDAGDDIEVLGVTEASRPASVALAYRPSPRDPRELQHTLRRPVIADGAIDERPYALRYVRRHETADRCLGYRATRALLSAKLSARIYRRALAIGDVITLSSQAFGLVTSTWRVTTTRYIAGGVQIDARPYSAALTTYTAGTLAADAVDDYQPDYSQTPPLAPTSLRITGGDSNALYGSYVDVDALPPAVNWAELRFVVEHDATGELIIQPGSDVGGGRHGLSLTGLRAGEVYKLGAYALNAFGLRGPSVTTADATGIGGGAAVTTFTAPGVANGAPAAPTSLRITGGGTDASLRSFVTVDALPPSANLGELWFECQHTGTLDVVLGRGEPVGGGRYGVTLGTLRRGESYWLRAFAVSPLAQQGGSVTTFNATAIGGGSSATTFAAPGVALGAPAAPTSMRVTASATSRATDGTIRARASVDCIAPASNAEAVYIVIRQPTTTEQVLMEARDVGGGRVGCTFQQLLPGLAYELAAYAKSAVNLAGPALLTFDATAVGGGASVTSFNAAGHAAAPGTVASINAAQGMGRIFNVSWPAVGDSDLADYELERSVGGGGYSVVWRGQARSYIDRGVDYGITYQYRVRARNTTGTYSAAYATSSGASLSTGSIFGGVSGNDIGGSTVDTANRTGATTISQAYSLLGLAVTSVNLSHGLGRLPVAVCSTSSSGHLCSAVSVSSSSISIRIANAGYATQFASTGVTEVNNSAGDPHTHNIDTHSHGPGLGGLVDGPGTAIAVIW